MLSVIIQAGGQSRRMGQNKALLPFLGRPLVERVIERIRPVADEMLLTSNEPDLFARFHLPVYPDVMPDIGALVGLLTALTYARHEFAAVVACDMPFASPALLAYALERLLASGADISVPHLQGGYEPFHAVYRRESCLAAVAAALAQNKRRMISWFDQVTVLELSEDELLRLDPQRLAFLNVNTREELEEAEALARAGEGGPN